MLQGARSSTIWLRVGEQLRPEATWGETGDDGRVALLRQDGWTIVYHAYTQAAAADWRPTRMTLSYPDVELRIAVDNWR